MPPEKKWKYGVVLDAGSSGTRLHLYRWLSNSYARQEATSKSLHLLPELETDEKWTKKTHPGISTFAETPSLVGSDHLASLVKHALKFIPQDQVSDTPVFLLATAGVRLLPDVQRTRLLQNVCDYFKEETTFMVGYCDSQFQVIPGDTEGLYGWVAANYLLGGFDDPGQHAHGKGHHTYGFLDMGGASAQIAFAPNATEAAKHSDDLTLLRLRNIDGSANEYRVFVTTWLHFGVNEARRRYVESLTSMYKGNHPSQIHTHVEMPDPCLPKGIFMSIEGKPIPTSAVAKTTGNYIIGTGKFDECLHQTYPLLQKDVPCPDEPCLLNGVHVPSIDFDVNHFIGISEYWHTTHEIFEMAYKDKAYDFNTYQQRVQKFCEQDWSTIVSEIEDKTYGKKVDEQTAYEVCFKASWLINILHDGIGIPRAGIENTTSVGLNGTKAVLDSGKEKGYLDPFQAVNKIKSTEVSWTMGKILLYASSDVPVNETALPVGFGSNQAGIPKDFHYPGGGGLLTSTAATKSDKSSGSLTGKLQDTLFHSDSPHRIPGMVLLLFIILIGMFYLCGRDRRSRFMNYILGSSKSQRGIGGFLPKWASRHHINYDRVLEDGGNLRDPADFELDEVDAAFGDDIGAGKTSDGSPLSRKVNAGGNISPELLDRHGLAIRTESRERLDLYGDRKSRAGSPSRMI